MICQRCGAELQNRVTDLPFKTGDRNITVIRDLPVMMCPQCAEFVLPDAVLAHVEEMLAVANEAIELEVIRYVA